MPEREPEPIAVQLDAAEAYYRAQLERAPHVIFFEELGRIAFEKGKQENE